MRWTVLLGRVTTAHGTTDEIAVTCANVERIYSDETDKLISISKYSGKIPASHI